MILWKSFLDKHKEHIWQKSHLLPVCTFENTHPVTCINCSLINRHNYNYCTECGFPIKPDEVNILDFNKRQGAKKDLIYASKYKIIVARNTLYILATFSMFGIFYLSSNFKAVAAKGLLIVLLGIIYAGLGKWSTQKPFTAMLIALIMTLTFVVINTWSEFTTGPISSTSVFLLLIQVAFIYILLQGVKGAFHADILEEEFKS